HQLETYARDPIVLATTRIKAKLLQQHIVPYLPEKELFSAEPALNPAQFQFATDAQFVSTPTQPSATSPTPPTLEAEAAEVSTLEERPANGNARYDMLRRSEQDAWRA